MGTIHLAIATGTGDFQKLVVLKELRSERATDPAFVELFLREAMLAGRLNHANVVQTIEAAQDDNRLFLAMEFLDGQPMTQLMRAQGLTPIVSDRFMLQVLCDTLSGLHYAHELQDYGGEPLGVVHCDVSPHNVFVTYDGRVKVVDFGIARAAGSGDAEGGFRGRLGYAAPEQILGTPVDRRADIFAVGVMLWELLAKRRFVQPGSDERETVSHRIAGAEPRISALVPTHPMLARICDKALDVDPAKRFHSAEEFRQALNHYLQVLGGPLDAAGIGSFMSLKFAGERRALHQLIHTHTRTDETEIKSRYVTLDPQVGCDEATRMGDLSPLVELTRADAIPSAPSTPLISRRRRIWYALGGAAIGMAVLAAGVFASKDYTPAAQTTGSPLLSTTRHALKPAPLASSSAATMNPPPEQALPSGTADALPRQAPSAPPEAAQPERREAPPPRASEYTQRPRADAERERPRSKRAPASAASASSTENSTGGAVTPPAPSGIASAGHDLKTLAPRQRRHLDSANPFR